MPSFKIKITETLSRIVDIEADSKDDALKNAREKYRNEEIFLDSDDYQRQILRFLRKENNHVPIIYLLPQMYHLSKGESMAC